MLLSNSFKIKMWVNFFRQINVFFWKFSNGVAPTGADRVESENWSQIRETNNSNACFLADSRSKCDLFSLLPDLLCTGGWKAFTTDDEGGDSISSALTILAKGFVSFDLFSLLLVMNVVGGVLRQGLVSINNLIELRNSISRLFHKSKQIKLLLNLS